LLNPDDAYRAIVAQLDGLPWHLAPSVTAIRPQNRKSLNFFPGQRGYAGQRFPIGGVMVVANNFTSLNGWAEYRASPDRESVTPTWRKMRVMLEGSGLPIDRFWFTNYCLGIMDRDVESYEFPAVVVKTLRFRQFFEASAEAMRPSVIVSLGRPAARHLSTDYEHRERIDVREFGTHTTKLIAAVHPSAWTWRGKGFGEDDFRREGARIAEAAA
jgi:hypothetical protein